MAKNYIWILNLFFITLLTYIVSDIFLTAIRTKLEISSGVKTSLNKGKVSQGERPPFDYYQIISRRNLFNSSPPAAEPDFPSPPEKIEESIPLVPPPLPPLNLKLAGTISSGPKNSFAIIVNLTTNKQDLYRIGDTIETATIIDIQRNKVLLKRSGKIETLSLTEKNELSFSPPRSFSPLHPPENGRPSSSFLGESDSGITQTGENSWDIAREEISNALGNLSQLMTQALLRPHFKEGRPDGFIVARIKPGSIFERIGIRKGDIIRRVNGVEITTPNDALELYSRLQAESVIQLQIEREGQLNSFVYNIN